MLVVVSFVLRTLGLLVLRTNRAQLQGYVGADKSYNVSNQVVEFIGVIG